MQQGFDSDFTIVHFPAVPISYFDGGARSSRCAAVSGTGIRAAGLRLRRQRDRNSGRPSCDQMSRETSETKTCCARRGGAWGLSGSALFEPATLMMWSWRSLTGCDRKSKQSKFLNPMQRVLAADPLYGSRQCGSIIPLRKSDFRALPPDRRNPAFELSGSLLPAKQGR